MTTSRASSSTPATGQALRRRLALVGAVAAILLAIGTRLAGAPVEEPAPAPLSASVAAVEPLPAAEPGCWVPGDLVGEANPANVRAVLCNAP